MLDTQAAQTRAYAKSSANQQAIVRSGQISGMRADYGSSGVETSGGSPLATLNENIRQSQLESMYTRLVANNDAVNLEQQANIARWNGKRANDAGWINAGSGLLAGVEQGVNQRLSLISGRF
jgi:hypothetical protein